MSDDRAKREFVLPWLCAAAIVTILRLLHAADAGYDLTLQIQGGQNLLAGRGLTFYWPTSQNLADPATLEILNHYPIGYSVYTAALTGLGAGVGTIIKAAGAVATMFGWWGWARLAFLFMSDGRSRRLWRAVAFVVAVVSPVLFTPPWGGTEIVLWAAVPWVLLLITRAHDQPAQERPWSDLLAGALVGVCVVWRYASLFLPAYAVLAIAGQHQRSIAHPARRLAMFWAGLLPVIVPQIYVSYFIAVRPAAPGGVVVNRDRLADLWTHAWETVSTLGGALNGLFFWAPRRLSVLWTEMEFEPLGLLLATVVLVVPALILVARRTQPVSRWCHDVRIVAGGLLVALPLFLWVCEIFGDYDFVHDPRYYWSLRPLSVLILFFLATAEHPARRAGLDLVPRYLSRACLAAFVLVATLEVGLIFAPTERGELRRLTMLGNTQLRPWPSLRLNYEFYRARDLVISLMQAEPHTILITNIPQWFYAAPEVDRSRIVRWDPCDDLTATHVSGPATFLLFAWDRGEPPEALRWTERAGLSDCLQHLPDLRVIRVFPEERLKILRAKIPQGVRLELKPA